MHEWSVRHETDVAIDYLRNSAGQRDPEAPFCLVVSHNPPHMPFNRVPAQYRRAYSTLGPERLLNRDNVRMQGPGLSAAESVEGYFAAITGIDEQFGRLLACLEEQGLADDTIVIFTADHGEMMGSHGRIGKGVWYEESVRIPFLLRWPGRIEPGQDDLLMSGADVHPTLLGLAGLADAISPQVQGTDYALLLRGAAMPRPSSAFYLLLANAHPELGNRGIRTHGHTFVRVREPGAAEQLILHDNRADPTSFATSPPTTPPWYAIWPPSWTAGCSAPATPGNGLRRRSDRLRHRFKPRPMVPRSCRRSSRPYWTAIFLARVCSIISQRETPASRAARARVSLPSPYSPA